MGFHTIWSSRITTASMVRMASTWAFTLPVFVATFM